MSRPYGNKIGGNHYVNRKRQTIATDWNDVSDDVEYLLRENNKLSSLVMNILHFLSDNGANIDYTNLFIDGNDQTTKFDEDFEIIDVEQGLYKDGDIIAQNTLILDVVKNMLKKQVKANYINPIVSINSIETLNVEIGETITPEFNIVYTKNDAGNIIDYSILLNDIIVFNNVTNSVLPYTAPTSTTLLDENTVLKYKTKIHYAEGIVKNDSLGNPDILNHITEGTIMSNTIEYKAFRKLFYTSDSNKDEELNSENIRNFESNIFNPQKGMKFQIKVNEGDNRYVFAYPTNLGEVTLVKDLQLGEVTDTLIKYVISVDGANNVKPIDYNVYLYKSAVNYLADTFYEITI